MIIDVVKAYDKLILAIKLPFTAQNLCHLAIHLHKIRLTHHSC